MTTLTLNHQDLADEPSFQAINRSLRALVPLKVDTHVPADTRGWFARLARRPAPRAFAPHPVEAQDSKGRTVQVGVLGLTDDGKIRFVNPKDSTDQYAVQTFDPNQGVLILPAADARSVSTLNSLVKRFTGGKRTVDLAEFDVLLKNLHWAYTRVLEETPDIYCDTFRQFDPQRHVHLGEGLYQKAATPETMYLIRVPATDTVAFHGTVKSDGGLEGAQFADGDFVVATGATKDGPYARKLDLAYAKANLVQPDGQPLQWHSLPSVDVGHSQDRTNIILPMGKSLALDGDR